MNKSCRPLKRSSSAVSSSGRRDRLSRTPGRSPAASSGVAEMAELLFAPCYRLGPPRLWAVLLEANHAEIWVYRPSRIHHLEAVVNAAAVLLAQCEC